MPLLQLCRWRRLCPCRSAVATVPAADFSAGAAAADAAAFFFSSSASPAFQHCKQFARGRSPYGITRSLYNLLTRAEPAWCCTMQICSQRVQASSQPAPASSLLFSLLMLLGPSSLLILLDMYVLIAPTCFPRLHKNCSSSFLVYLYCSIPCRGRLCSL